MPADWHGFYINLDTSPDRRKAIEATIARAGLSESYQRFPAVTGADMPATCRLRPGEYGCFRSHHDLLAGLTPDGNFVHVLEDDAVLARTFGPAMQTVLSGGLLEPFDIVFTETMIGSDPPLLRMLKGLFDRGVGKGKPLSLSLIDLKTLFFAGTSSFFVNPQFPRSGRGKFEARSGGGTGSSRRSPPAR